MTKERINFCTLFDSHYISRGITMYRSLEKTGCSFHLYVFAFDDKCLAVLKKAALPHLTVVSLAEFEDEELLKVKSTRTRAEYCWTSSSSTILYCLEKYSLSNCTYIDADLFFYNDPSVIIDEMGDHSILITEHRYTPKYDITALSGKYCVQFVTFKNDAYGLKVLHWWRNACLEWCYNRHEEGRFGDQKYLDDWTTRFEKVHVMKHLGGGLALWNIQQYETWMDGDRLSFREKSTGKEFTPLFYHFHYIKYFRNGRVELGRRDISQDILQHIYLPYLREMEITKEMIVLLDPSIDPHGAVRQPGGLKGLLVKGMRKMKSVYHIYDLKTLLYK